MNWPRVSFPSGEKVEALVPLKVAGHLESSDTRMMAS